VNKKFGHCSCCSLSSGRPPIDLHSIKYAMSKQKPEPVPFWKHLEEKLRLAEEALEFYADKRNYISPTLIASREIARKYVDSECGTKARAALEKIRDLSEAKGEE